MFNLTHFLTITDEALDRKIRRLETTLERLENTQDVSNSAIVNKRMLISRTKRKREALIWKDQQDYFEKFHFKVENPLSYIKVSYGEITLYTEDKLYQLYRHIDEGKWIKKWTKQVNIRNYLKMNFAPPPVPCREWEFNTFPGLVPVPDVEPGDCSIIQDHFKRLVNHEEAGYEYLMNYLAHMVQKPGEIPNVAIVFKSDQGVGKNLIFEQFIGKELLGRQLYYQTADVNRVLGQFSSIENKIMVILDETSGRDTFLVSDKIKNLITADTIPWEQKYIAAINVKNCARYLFFSNNDTPVKIEMSDRRFVVFEADNSVANQASYFGPLIKAMKDPSVICAFYKFLLDRDISEWNSITHRPITKAYKNIQSVNIPIVARFLQDYVERDDFKTKIKPISFYQRFTSWKISQGIKTEISNTRFALDLKKYDGITKTARLYILNKEELITFLKMKNYYEGVECIVECSSDDED